MKTTADLDLITSVVLAYRPAKQEKKSAKRQKRAAKKAAKKTKGS